jgi:hypothetical protein
MNFKNFYSVFVVLFALSLGIGSVMATTINVAEGTDAISTALGAASPGDTLVLITDGGAYTETAALTVNIDITIISAEGLTNKPVWTTSGTNHIELESNLVLEGIILSGEDAVEIALLNKASSPNKISIDTCDFHGFTNEAIGEDTATLDSIWVTNCLFYDGDAAMKLDGDEDTGVPGVHYIFVENCTIYNMGDEGIRCEGFDLAGNTSSVAYISHVTINDCDEGVYLKAFSSSTEVTNSIITNSDIGVTVADGGAVIVTYSIVWNNSEANFDDDASGDETTLDEPPLFEDPDNGDFDLYANSSAVGAASDNENMGDLRWQVLGTEAYLLTVNLTGTGFGQVVLDPPGGIYSLNDIVQAIAIPDTGSKFDSWSGDVSSTEDTIQVTMDASKTIDAEFKKLPRLFTNVIGTGTVTLDPPQGSLPGGFYDIGEMVTLTANPDVGEDFLGWMGDLTTTNTIETMALDEGEYYVTAQFAPSGSEIVTVEGVFSNTMDYSFIGLELVPETEGTILHEETKIGIVDDGGSDTLTISSASLQLADGDLYLATLSTKGHSQSGTPGTGLRRTVNDTIWGLGLTWTRVADVRSMRNATHLDMYWAQGTPSGQDSVTAVVHSFPAGYNVVISVSRYSGVDASTPIGNLVPVNAGGFQIPGSELSGERVSSSKWYKIDYSIKVPVSSGSGVAVAVAHRNRGHIPPGDFTLRGDVMNQTSNTGDRNSIAAMDDVGPFFKLAIATEGSGSVNLDPLAGSEFITLDTVRYNPGTEVTAKAVPAADWIFTGWSGDLSGTENPQTLTMDADKSITASYVEGETVDLEGTFSNTVDYVLLAAELQPAGEEDIRFEEFQSGIVEGATEDTFTVVTDEALTAVEGDLYLALISTKKRSEALSVSGLGLEWGFLKDQAGARDQTWLSLWIAKGIPTGDEVVSAEVTNVSIGKDVVLSVSRYSGVDTLGSVKSWNTFGEDGAETGGTDVAEYSYPFHRAKLKGLIFTAMTHRLWDYFPAPGHRIRSFASAATSGNTVSITTADYLYHPIEVGAAQGAISSAVASAPEEGFLVLTEAGPYFESDSIVIDKDLYIVADKAITPIVRSTARCVIELKSSLKLDGLQFLGAPGVVSAVINRSDVLNDLVIYNCEFSGFDGAVITNDEDNLKAMNRLMVISSFFHDAGAGIEMNGDHPQGAGQHPDNIPGAHAIWMENSSFYNLDDLAIKHEAYMPTGLDTGYAYIFHVTINNCGGEGIYLKEVSPISVVANSIITNCDAGVRIKYAPANLLVSYSDVWNNVENYKGSDGGNASAGTGTISADPMFIDPASGDLNITDTSPCKGTAEDGENMGDIVHWGIVTAIEGTQIPKAFALEQNYPNPFNPSTTINFSVPIPAEVNIQIYNTLGQKVKSFIIEKASPGIHKIIWNGNNQTGRKVASGIYFYRMEAKPIATKRVEFTRVQKMIMLK